MGLPTNTVKVGECGLGCSIRTQLGGNSQHMESTRSDPMVITSGPPGGFCVRPEILLLASCPILGLPHSKIISERSRYYVVSLDL